jgi:PAS domain S-box-containing protein
MSEPGDEVRDPSLQKILQYGEAERFRLLVEQVSEYAIFVLDPQGCVVTWNAGAQRIKGYRPDEIIGQHFSKFYRPEDTWKCAYELDVAQREGRVEDEGWRVRKDGSLFWANVVITSLRDQTGELVGFAKVTRDLTARRQIEESLRQSEERFRLLLENVRDYAIFMLDERGRITTWNVGAERIKGYRADEIIGQHFSRFYPAEDVRAGKCDMELERAARDGRFEDEGWRIRKDGSRFWANVVITALRDSNGKVFGFAKVTRDLTERKRAEEERLRAGQLAQTRVRAMTAIAEVLANTFTAAEVASAVIERGMSVAQADTCTLYLLNPQTMALELFAEHGCNPAVLASLRTVTPSSGNPTYAIGTGSAPAVWIENARDYAAYFPALAALPVTGERAQAFACIPLVAESRILGMIGLGFRQERTFAGDEREFIHTFARQCAQALARARRLESERAAFALADRLRSSLSTTLRSIGDAVIATDASGRITLMNSVAEALTGWREDEARGRPITEIFHIVNEHTRAVVPNPVEKVLEVGGIVGLANHTVLIARDGREIPIDDSGAPIRSEDGSTTEGVVLVFRDVTERKLAEMRSALVSDASTVLAQSLDYEATIARVAQLAVPRFADWCAVDICAGDEPKRVAVAHVDPSKIELAKELARKYPRNPEAVTGVPQVLRTGIAELHREIPDQLLVAGCVDAEHLRIVRELRLRSAMIVPLMKQNRTLGAISFVYSTSGRTYSADDLRTAEDLARRCADAIENARLYLSEQEARKHADVANRAKDEFLAIVSHELRTPLNAIMGWAKLLSSADFDEARRQRAMETIERNAVAMAQLIDDLLDMSRVISGKMKLDIQRVEMLGVMEAAIDSIRPAATAKDIELVPMLEGPTPKIMGDPTRLQQIVWNMLSNAVKFTHKGGRVTVQLCQVGSSIDITVADNGKGIAPSFLPHVFEAFRQEDASISRARGGLGLGLSITRQLVELHGGHITAQSSGEGHGATFTVSLPISTIDTSGERKEDLGAGAAPHERPHDLRGLRVLVVDDEEDARQLITTILEECECRVMTAASAREALLTLERERPDVMLSDIGMPGEDGIELIRNVRRLPHDHGGSIPAAALTAYARAQDRRAMLNAGYSMHLAKPIEPAELIAAVATLARFLHRE